ncbi:hypothetical protein MFIFM68171_06272 [Madurella fahalii]|uniref:Uncharacterized protein n=1 Tax=Madurella fahalii TaxID=1157608 RepID=A0ABQ0GEA6_9PEZI
MTQAVIFAPQNRLSLETFQAGSRIATMGNTDTVILDSVAEEYRRVQQRASCCFATVSWRKLELLPEPLHSPCSRSITFTLTSSFSFVLYTPIKEIIVVISLNTQALFQLIHPPLSAPAPPAPANASTNLPANGNHPHIPITPPSSGPSQSSIATKAAAHP